jgi:hypothetical protein
VQTGLGTFADAEEATMDDTGMVRVRERIDVERTRRTALTTALGAAALAALGVGTSGPETAAKKKKRCSCKPKAVGEFCTSNKECCANETNYICAIRAGQSGLRCCGGLGAKCPAPGDCCGGFDCVSGRCRIHDD